MAKMKITATQIKKLYNVTNVGTGGPLLALSPSMLMAGNGSIVFNLSGIRNVADVAVSNNGVTYEINRDSVIKFAKLPIDATINSYTDEQITTMMQVPEQKGIKIIKTKLVMDLIEFPVSVWIEESKVEGVQSRVVYINQKLMIDYNLSSINELHGYDVNKPFFNTNIGNYDFCVMPTINNFANENKANIKSQLDGIISSLV